MQAGQTRRLRAACDFCHNAKMKCSGRTPCASCASSGRQCVYSFSNKLGRPKGGKNKKPPIALPTDHVAAGNLAQGVCQAQQNDDELGYQDMGADAFTTAAADDGPMSWNFLDSVVGDMDNSQLSSHLGTSMIDPAQMDFTTHTSSFSNLGPSTLSTDLAPISLDNHDPPNQPQQNNRFPQGQDHRTSTITSQLRESDPTQSTECGCVQRHAKFFCRLKDADKANSICVSATLADAKNLLNLFNRSHMCPSCRKDDDNDAQVLLVLCIRTVLKRFRKCIQSQRHLSRNLHNESCSSPDPSSSSATFQSLQPVPKQSFYNVRVDNLDLSQDDQAYLVNMLVVRTVKEIKQALRALKDIGNERDKERQAGFLSPGSTNDLAAGAAAWTQERDSESGQELEGLIRDDRFLCNAIESLCDGLQELEHSLATVCNIPHFL